MTPEALSQAGTEVPAWAQPAVLLAIVAIINALGAAAALIIHSVRVPYRESDRAEQVHATEAGLKLRASYPPPAAPASPPEA